MSNSPRFSSVCPYQLACLGTWEVVQGPPAVREVKGAEGIALLFKSAVPKQIPPFGAMLHQMMH